MLLQTYGDRRNPAVLFFHAMGVTGASSEPIARYLQDRYFCILPTSTVYCEGQKYVSKQDEIRQVEDFLHRQGVERLAMVVASSIGADLAMAFLTQTKLPVEHAFFDGGQFAQIGKGTRRIMTPFLYFAIKSLYWSKGGTLKKILWCDDDSIKSYFIDAGKNGLFAEDLLGEVFERLLHVGERNPFVDVEALDLMEDAVGAVGDRLVAEDAARTDHADRRPLALHRAHLDRRGVRAQQDVGILFDEERVLHVACRMFGREIERREDMPVILDFGAVGDGVAQPRVSYIP